MEQAPYSKIEKGTFLISTPEIDTGIFFRSVVLICEHSHNGSFGLIVNKNLELELPEDIINLSNLSNPHIEIRAGGPVQTNQMMLLHDSDKITPQTMEVCEGVFLGGDIQFLQDAITREEGPHVLLCFGYSGWSAGLLEREFLDGHWFLYPANNKLLFETEASKLWQTILKQMGGKYASLSMIPEDLSLN